MHYSILLGKLVADLGCIEGRKKMQKIVYILQSADAPFDERFDFSFYGPYSDNLRNELEALQQSGVIEEKPNGETYQFLPGPRVSDIMSKTSETLEFAWIDFAKALNKYQPRELEALSTVLFLLDSDYQAEALNAKFDELKPLLTQYRDWSLKAAHKIHNDRGQWKELVNYF